MNVIEINVKELRILEKTYSSFVLLIYANWSKSLNNTKVLNLLNEIKLSCKVIFCLRFVEDCDEMNQHIFEGLKINSLPCIYLYDESASTTSYSMVESWNQKRITFSNHENPVIVDGNDNGLLSELIDYFRQNSIGTLFIAGDKSSVGKSSICLAILSTLLQLGFESQKLAYIKPVTQCEADQLVTRYCDDKGIACRGIGPVVFYKGFTRAFLNRETESSEDLIAHAVAAVNHISDGKSFVLVDGVGVS
jgi:hypothetical protein